MQCKEPMSRGFDGVVVDTVALGDSVGLLT